MRIAGRELVGKASEYAMAGADALFNPEFESERRSLAHELDARLLAPPPEAELRFFAEALSPSKPRTVALHCLRNGYRRREAESIANWFDVTYRSVNSVLAAAGIPPSGLLSRCGTHLHQKELRRSGVRSLPMIAHRLGFETVGALRRSRERTIVRLHECGETGLVLLSLLTS